MAPSEYTFDKVDLWVRIHDVPVEILTPKVVVKLGSRLGEVILPIPPGVVETWSSYARIKVRLNINLPLQQSIISSLPNGVSNSFWSHMRDFHVSATIVVSLVMS